MDKEEKALEVVLEALLNRCQDLKNAISSFIFKLETEQLSWPNVLDNFALLSGQVNTILKILRNEKTPLLRNRVTLPLLLSPDRDEELAKLTENRVPSFNHETVPDYLRTKFDTDVELREQQYQLKAGTIPVDMAQKQIANTNKIVNNILDSIKVNREAWENESNQRNQLPPTSNIADTTALIAAITMGRGLRPSSGSPKGQIPNPQMPSQQPSRPASGGKMPSTIKTNIKSAGSMHPYGR